MKILLRKVLHACEERERAFGFIYQVKKNKLYINNTNTWEFGATFLVRISALESNWLVWVEAEGRHPLLEKGHHM